MAPGKKGKHNVITGKAHQAAADQAQTAADQAAANAVPPGNGILQDLPPPITVIDVSDPEGLADNYEKAIGHIIQTMMTDSDAMFNFQEADGTDKCRVPITPGADSSPNGAYVIELTDGKKRLQLVAEKYQTWFRGIVTDNGGRYEIDEKEPKIMAGSQSLHTTAVYYDLLGGTVDKCKVGYNPFLSAFHTLVGLDFSSKNKKADYKTAIAVLLVMLFEAPRFPELYERNLSLLKEKGEGLVGEEGKDLINDWGDICDDFYKKNGNNMTVNLSDKTDDAVKKVVKSVRVLCRSRWDTWLTKNKEDAPKPLKWKPPQKLKEAGSSSSK